jgi:ribosomal protein S18 acetylase RimI-like enzyme
MNLQHRNVTCKEKAMTQMLTNPIAASVSFSWAADDLCIVPAQLNDCDSVIDLFGALHNYNASLDTHFMLADGWENLLCCEFRDTAHHPDHLWMVVKEGDQAVGLLIAAIHTDSPMFRYRHWVEVEALYVAPSHRCIGIAQRLLDQAYQWTEVQGLSRIQLYVTASNVRAQSVYSDQGFNVTQAIMRKSLG